VPQHMPGAGGNKGTNFLYNVAPKDGSTIGMVPDGLVISSVLRPDQIKYKPAEFTWIGSVERLPTVLMIRSGGTVKSVADLASRELVVGSSGRGSGTYLFPSLLRWLTGGKVKIVQGYKGVRDMINAMERGEVQGTAVGYGAWLNLKSDWIESGYIIPLAQFGVEKEPTLPDTPLASDLGRTADAKSVARFMASNAQIGRGFVVPPRVPGDKIAALRTAFDSMLKDPAFVADLKQRNLVIKPASGAEVQQAVEEAVAIGARLGPIMRAEVFGGGKDK
jgi:tripartite-type tricarboxylate transporter receptor subunit TctC